MPDQSPNKNSNERLAQLLNTYSGIRGPKPSELVPKTIGAISIATAIGVGLLAWAKAGWEPCITFAVIQLGLATLIVRWGKYAPRKQYRREVPP